LKTPPSIIAVLNDYSLPKALALVIDGTYPAHHTWGVSQFGDYGLKVGPTPFLGAYLNFVRPVRLRTLVSSFLAQIWLLICQGSFDAVFSACQSETWLLSRLRRFGLFRRPIIMLVHHPLVGRLRGGESFVSGHDQLLFLSQKVLVASKTKYPEMAQRMNLLPWGVDFFFYDHIATPSEKFGSGFFVSAGKANRDHSTLADASRGLGRKVVIVCSEASKPHRLSSENVEVVCDTTGHALSYSELLSVYNAALAIVIPLENVDALAGLTSLLDAMACGKPVIMTRNPYIDIDIERNGFGIWVEPGDCRGLHAAMMSLNENAPLVKEMGIRAREYAVQKLSYGLFCENLSKRIKGEPT
jgi:glycosyltransferase involved in cell wall biosynthesis